MSAVLAAALLSACSTATQQEPVTATPSAPAAESVAPATAAPSDAPASAAQAGPAADLPAAVTGYTGEAREEMADDNVTEADVAAALEAARNGNAEVSWDDDGYWEIEWNDIDIDITPEGMVLEADR
ncbi:hypothetical protein JZY91_04145 [Corynebacterium sp. CNCTC7651]|nr:hypothetical protein [Corynebacterium sp. CNCTC7651]UIZ92940.1 hypothetical protein JZY91_04145 [Corynebacterium sp. CNCTC7651]